jgi:hypothetical protein
MSCKEMSAWMEVTMDECVSGEEVLCLMSELDPGNWTGS